MPLAMDMRQTVGFNLRRLRAAAGLSQEELAAKTGLGRSYISGIEGGRRNPRQHLIPAVDLLDDAVGIGSPDKGLGFAMRLPRIGGHLC